MQQLVIELKKQRFIVPANKIKRVIGLDAKLIKNLYSGLLPDSLIQNGELFRLFCLKKLFFGEPTNPIRGSRLLNFIDYPGKLFLSELVLGLSAVKLVNEPYQIVDGVETKLLELGELSSLLVGGINERNI